MNKTTRFFLALTVLLALVGFLVPFTDEALSTIDTFNTIFLCFMMFTASIGVLLGYLTKKKTHYLPGALLVAGIIDLGITFSYLASALTTDVISQVPKSPLHEDTAFLQNISILELFILLMGFISIFAVYQLASHKNRAHDLIATAKRFAKIFIIIKAIVWTALINMSILYHPALLQLQTLRSLQLYGNFVMMGGRILLPTLWLVLTLCLLQSAHYCTKKDKHQHNLITFAALLMIAIAISPIAGLIIAWMTPPESVAPPFLYMLRAMWPILTAVTWMSAGVMHKIQQRTFSHECS